MKMRKLFGPGLALFLAEASIPGRRLQKARFLAGAVRRTLELAGEIESSEGSSLGVERRGLLELFRSEEAFEEAGIPHVWMGRALPARG